MKKILCCLSIFLIFFSSICLANSENISALINKKITINYGTDIHEHYVTGNIEEERYHHATKYLFENCSFYDVKGNEVFPISYDGTTYLPIRAISGLLKIKIKWDGEKNSIYLGEGEIDFRSVWKNE